MDIYQMQATYSTEQDRILLRLNTRTHEEFQIWLTRRMIKGLFAPLVQATTQLVSETTPLVSHDSAAPNALATFKKQEDLASADFKTPYNALPMTMPLGQTPLLVSKVQLTPVGGKSLRLAFAEKPVAEDAPRQFEVTLGQPVMHSLLHLLETVLVTADWGFALPAPSGPLAPALAGPDPEADLHDALAAAKPPVYLN